MNSADIRLSQHCTTRMKQRSIKPMIVELLLEWGKYVSRGDSYTVFFDVKSMKNIKSYGGAEFVSFIEKKYRNSYLILSRDGVVITTGWKNKNMRFKEDGYRKNKLNTVPGKPMQAFVVPYE